MEVIEAARRITNRKIETSIEPARAGDPSRLVANAERARSLLGWRPQYPELETIVRTAWEWHQAHPDGYTAGSGTGPA
jgi:UDP-glucose 4-epimerase